MSPTQRTVFEDLGRLDYDAAYARQTELVERLINARSTTEAAPGAPTNVRAHVLFVEHDPVITVSRRPGAAEHLIASDQTLRDAGVDVRQTDRGGDVTYHGPGQLVVYPIVDLNALRLRLHAYLRLLEDAVIAVCAGFGLDAHRDFVQPPATGVWVGGSDAEPLAARKIAAMGVRVRQWVSMHGLALNVTTDLRHFQLIVPCGLAGRPVTTMHAELGSRTPTMAQVKSAMQRELGQRLEELAVARH